MFMTSSERGAPHGRASYGRPVLCIGGLGSENRDEQASSSLILAFRDTAPRGLI